MQGNFEVPRVRYQRSRAQLEEFGWRFFAALISLNSAPIEILAGDLDAAEDELRKAYRTLDQMGERNYISTIAGMLADVLYRQGRYQESTELAGVCRDLASPDDVASQFLWRCVQAKLLAREGEPQEPDALLAEALDLIGASDWVDWQGNGFMDLAEVCRLRGRTADAVEALGQASARFAAKGNVVSWRRAEELADELRGSLPSTVLDSAQSSAPAFTRLNRHWQKAKYAPASRPRQGAAAEVCSPDGPIPCGGRRGRRHSPVSGGGNDRARSCNVAAPPRRRSPHRHEPGAS
jgi:ATP/maltotriose-dependent transcriptional regulator MalT